MVPFIGHSSHHEGSASDLIISQGPPLPRPSKWALGFQHMNGGGTQIFSLQQGLGSKGQDSEQELWWPKVGTRRKAAVRSGGFHGQSG